MRDTDLDKADLRSVLRQRRLCLSSRQQNSAARALPTVAADIPAWPTARRVALYLAADGEIDTAPLETLARKAGKELFLPVITRDNSLVFAAWETRAALAGNRYGIPEPPPQAPRCPVAELDILFLPLVGWDLSGGRLGMGGGFYDRTLAGLSGPLLVGLAHTVQQVDSVPMEDWDVRLDFVATDTALYRCQG